MIRVLAKTESERVCSAALIETDRTYFEMAAEIEPLSCGTLAWMPELTNLAASCVVHRVEGIPANFDQWLDQVESKFAERGVPLVRIYLDTCTDDLRQAFEKRGFQRRAEIGFLAPPGDIQVADNIRFREVLTEADWQVKMALHEEAMYGPDGYSNQADLWVEMERRKCATGEMRTFLVEQDNAVCGTVGAIEQDRLLRLKNILIAPTFRRMGLGVATVHLLRRMAAQQTGRRLGVFGVEGGAGSRLYRRAGLKEINCQVEWSRSLQRFTDE